MAAQLAHEGGIGADLIAKLICAVPCWKCVIECEICTLLYAVHELDLKLNGDGQLTTQVYSLRDLGYWLGRNLEAKQAVVDRIKVVLAAWEKPAQTLDKILTDNAKAIDDIKKILATDSPGAIFALFAKVPPERLDRATVLLTASSRTSVALLELLCRDVWQVRPDRLYDVQDPAAPTMQLRGKVRSDAQGRFAFRTARPVSYAIPDDGTVGKMLRALGRHPWRPAHIHFIVSAPSYDPVTTHLFVDGDPYLDSDAVFGVKNSLIVNFECHPPGLAPDGSTLAVPYFTVDYDFGLKPRNA